jgi:hypothetical protein
MGGRTADLQNRSARQVATQLAATRQGPTPEEFRAWIDSVAQFSDKIPPLPETISREWIYQDHDSMDIAPCVVDHGCVRRPRPSGRFVPFPGEPCSPFPTGRKKRAGIEKSFPTGRNFDPFPIDNALAYVLG